MDGRTTPGDAFDPAPASASLGPLFHGNKSDVFPARAGDGPRLESPAVVLDANEEAPSAILEGHRDPGKLRCACERW